MSAQRDLKHAKRYVFGKRGAQACGKNCAHLHHGHSEHGTAGNNNNTDGNMHNVDTQGGKDATGSSKTAKLGALTSSGAQRDADESGHGAGFDKEQYLRVDANKCGGARAGRLQAKDRSEKYACMHPDDEIDVEVGGRPKRDGCGGDGDNEDALLVHVHGVECMPPYIRNSWKGEKQHAMLVMMLQIGQVSMHVCVYVCV